MAEDFSKTIGSLKVDMEKATEKYFRQLLLTLLGSLIFRTPVDTGRAKNNWQLDTGSPPTGTLGAADKDGDAAMRRVKTIIDKWDVDRVMFAVNNLRYIGRLDDGHSKQAALGFSRQAIQEMEAVARQLGIDL